ncbi:MAG TPA: class IV adenylate cyclase [Bryobacteraceae bacterium]|nr:class IV adenylate cyclase [Bryobacteraceae bacterium]
MSSKQETEIKLAVPDAGSARRLLRAAGFRVLHRRVFEANTVFDTPELALRKRVSLLRVREAGRTVTLTYKGPPAVSRHKSREELEIEIPSAPTISAILERLGFHVTFRYEKYRTEFHQPGRRGIAMLDETPIGVFLELEGTPRWIDRSARKLGFDDSVYITASYGRLYLEWCAGRGVKPSNMVWGLDR